MVKLGSNYLRLSNEAIFHMKPSDIVTVSSDGEDTRIIVYSENGFTRLEVVISSEIMSLLDIMKFYKKFAPNRLQLH